MFYMVIEEDETNEKAGKSVLNRRASGEEARFA